MQKSCEHVENITGKERKKVRRSDTLRLEKRKWKLEKTGHLHSKSINAIRLPYLGRARMNSAVRLKKLTTSF